ncbi:MAG: AIPR family protein [Nitrospiraceae bacterium]|nr:AIPR family protein [Nitrospiraceae bacterium]
MLQQILQEIGTDPFYQGYFPNDGQRFVAWYLRRVLLRDDAATRDDITDGANDKQIDAVIVDDTEQRILIVQGKFINTGNVDAEPLREVLSAWVRLQDLSALQKDCNDRLKKKIEAIRTALDDDYRIDFELLTTGMLTDAAKADLAAYADKFSEFDGFAASLHLIDTPALETRLAEAEARVLPAIRHTITLDPAKTLSMDLPGARTVIAAVPLRECLNLPGITDGKLFAKNVRQSLGSSNKVNRELSRTIHSDKVHDFFFYHNGITALCDAMELSPNRSSLTVDGLSVVNGCQSLNTIYSASERIRSHESKDAHVLFRFYEIKDRTFGDRISINTNSQSVVKPRDLRSNDRVMVGLKKAFETRYPDGMFMTKRGDVAPATKDPSKVVDAATFAKMLMAWHCQRPNYAANEKKLFDEYYKTLFKTGYSPESMLTLHQWMNAIEVAWPNLNLNNELKAGKMHVKYHVLFAVSALINAINKQPTLVVDPKATVKALEATAEILPLAATCIENAMQSARLQDESANKVFSPQNWLKANRSWQGETLVAGTQAGMLGTFVGGGALMERAKAPTAAFIARWSAD